MPGTFRRAKDRARGKLGRYTIWWIGDDGKRKNAMAFTDKAKSMDLALFKEGEARKVREGMVDRGERTRREAALKPMGDHIDDYRLGLLAKGGCVKHATHVAGTLRRLLADAAIMTVAEIVPERVQAALGRLRQKRSPRTANHALGAAKAFSTWLKENNRISEVPRGLKSIPRFSEEVDRKRVRRAASIEEIERLFAAAETGPTIEASRGTRKQDDRREITGPERAILYRLALGTGFRADELRTLTPERFHLDGEEPTVTVLACYSKNGKEAIQPITEELAARLRPFVAGKEPGTPFLNVPTRTAEMLNRDLKAAGIPYRDDKGRYFDFHSLRGTYITQLIKDGANPRIVQLLARHSTVTLTLERYTSMDAGDLRDAIRRKK